MPLYDWECQICETIHEGIASRFDPREQKRPCKACDAETDHRRLIGLPAEYLKEKIRANHMPRIRGGTHDTEGFTQAPRVPDLPGADEHDKKTVIALSNATTHDERIDAALEAGRDAPSVADYREHMQSPEIRERTDELRAIESANTLKRERAAAIDSGRATLAESPLPCDSKLTHR